MWKEQRGLRHDVKALSPFRCSLVFEPSEGTVSGILSTFRGQVCNRSLDVTQAESACFNEHYIDLDTVAIEVELTCESLVDHLAVSTPARVAADRPG